MAHQTQPHKRKEAFLTYTSSKSTGSVHLRSNFPILKRQNTGEQSTAFTNVPVFQISNMFITTRGGTRGYIRMPNRMIAIDGNVKSTRSLEAKRPIGLEKCSRALVRARDLVCYRVGHSILGRSVALRRVEEDVFAAHVVEGRCFHVRAVERFDVCQNLQRASDHFVAVVEIDLLDEDRSRDDGVDGVTALAAVADGVTVNFVDDVALVLLHVVEAADVDGAALLYGADPGLGGVVDEGAFDVVACCVAETVDCTIPLQSCGVVEYILPTRQRNDIWSPDARVCCVYPRREFGHCIFLASEYPGFPVLGVCHGNVDFLAIDRDLGGICSPAIVCSDDCRIREVPAVQAWRSGCVSCAKERCGCSKSCG
jgi:hypothetical protein